MQSTTKEAEKHWYSSLWLKHGCRSLLEAEVLVLWSTADALQWAILLHRQLGCRHWIKQLPWAWSRTEPASTPSEVFTRHLSKDRSPQMYQRPPLPQRGDFQWLQAARIVLDIWEWGSMKYYNHSSQNWPLLPLLIFLGQLMVLPKEGKGVRPSFLSHHYSLSITVT